MTRANNPNLEILRLAIHCLGELADEFAFVGGSATGLLITDPAAPPIRPTDDVDAIVEILSHADYHKLSKKLRNKGFTEDRSDGAPLCRWKHGALTLDVMPTSEKVLGFGNVWYEPALTFAKTTVLPTGESVRLITAPYFLITKLAAFDGRGRGDYQLSHDIEDFIAVIDGREELQVELGQSDPELQAAIADRVGKLLNNPRFMESLPGHMPGDAASQQRVSKIEDILKSIALRHFA